MCWEALFCPGPDGQMSRSVSRGGVGEGPCKPGEPSTSVAQPWGLLQNGWKEVQEGPHSHVTRSCSSFIGVHIRFYLKMGFMLK